MLDFYGTRFDIKLPDFVVFWNISLSVNQTVSAVCTFFFLNVEKKVLSQSSHNSLANTE